MKKYKYCLRCGRRLEDAHARAIGYGAICEQKVKTSERMPRLITPKKV